MDMDWSERVLLAVVISGILWVLGAALGLALGLATVLLAQA